MPYYDTRKLPILENNLWRTLFLAKFIKRSNSFKAVLKAQRQISKKQCFIEYCQLSAFSRLTLYTPNAVSLKRVEKKKILERHNKDICSKIC